MNIFLADTCLFVLRIYNGLLNDTTYIRCLPFVGVSYED